MSEHRHAPSTWADLLAAGRLPRFALICLGVWLNAADALVTATIMPSVGADLGGYAFFSWSVAGFLLGAILAGASAGRFSEIVGLRPATVMAGLVLTAGCVLSALAPGMGLFLLGRVVQGAGSGWMSGLAMVAIAFLFPERHLGRIFAAVAAVWGLATILGPLLGGLLAAAGSWRTVFWIFAAQAALFAVAARFLLPREATPAQAATVPWRQLGLLCLAVAAIGCADMIQRPGLALALVGLGLGLLVWLLRFDRRATHRLLPRMAANLGAVPGAGYAAMFFLTATSIGFLIYGPALLQQLHGLTPLAAGYAVAAHAMAWTLAAFVVSGATPQTGDRWIRLGAACILAGPILLALVMREAAVPLVIAAAVIMGAGFGFSSALMNRRVLAALPDEDRAIGSSALIAVRQTGEAVGAAIAGATANLAGFGAGLTLISARSTALWVFIAALPLALAGAMAAWRMTRLPHGEDGQGTGG
ncbi:MFS transporter [Pedomonas mirosovicensis]|uniref:MFS transporter n=1 Tax=Pedomonas mirosovicensis TaxID=2908641 RepID=UPI002167674A|nr:MFS transporter [Pedomonas mirosovicensis]MCH8683858.1 MFS transporter [Pedomonas mirosovicensis]